MEKTHPLNLNLRKVVACLNRVLNTSELGKVEAELYRNVRQAIRLSEAHLRYAQSAVGARRGSWRQVVSRGYYCCYCASRAVRLSDSGTFSTEVEDHKKIGDLPDAFPERNKWEDILTKFRGDRNVADYDHTAGMNMLEYSPREYLGHAETFLQEVKTYLHSGGAI